MGRGAVVGLGLTLFCILGGAALWSKAEVVEQTIEARARRGLDQAGLERVLVDADGRDLYLTGQVDRVQDRDRAESQARATWGHRVVHNQVQVVAPKTPDVPHPDVVASRAVSAGSRPAEPPPPSPAPIAAKTSPAEPPPSPEPAVCPDRVRTAIATKRIHFEFNRARPTEEDRLRLGALARAIQSCRGSWIRLEGHTDSTGPEAYNQALSERRAQAVLRALQARGVAADRLRAVGFGLRRPLRDNATAADRALNRRVELRVLEEKPDAVSDR